MSIKFKDTFAGSPGSLLAHTSDSGDTYTTPPTSQPAAAVIRLDGTGFVYNDGPAGTAYVSSASTANLTYPATLAFTLKIASTVDGSIGQSIYRASGSPACLLLRYYNNGQGFDALQLLQLDASGGNVLLGQQISLGWSPGLYQISLVINSPGSYAVFSGSASSNPVHSFDASTSTPLSGGFVGINSDAPCSPSTGFLVGSTTLTDAATGTITRVTLGPATSTVTGGSTQQFSATVVGAGNPRQDVTWATSLGSISATGLLTAPPFTNAPQSLTVTATSVADPTKSGTAAVVVAAAVPPSIGPITVSSADGVDLITYPAPVAGSRPVLNVALLVGTTPGGQSAIPVAIATVSGSGSFVYPSGTYRYKLVATDVGSPPLSSALSNEVAGAVMPRGLPTTFAQTSAIIQNVLSTFFPPDLLAGLAKLKANALEVDLQSVAGSTVAASSFRDQVLSQATSQTTLDAFGAVVATQLQTQFSTTLPPALLAGLAKLQAPTIDVNVVQFAGSATAATNLRNEELSQTISTSAVTAISAATAAKLSIPSATDTASAVWSNATRTLTQSPTS